MRKILLVVFCGAVVCGCRTSLKVEKNPEKALPVYAVARDGTNAVPYIARYIVTSGGWELSAYSPLWAAESFKGLSAEIYTNGTLRVGLDAYTRDLSTNTVAMAHNLVSDFALLAEKVAAAYATAGASVAAAGAKRAVSKAIASYILKGGDPQKAKVTCADGNCTFSDGIVTEVCTDCWEP